MLELDAAAFDKLREVRGQLDNRFLGRQNVTGSMLGLKLRAGKPLNRPVFTVFVASKEPVDALPKSDRIPRRVTIDGETFHTDVIAVSELVFQNDVFPTAGALTTFDGAGNGTLTAFAVSPHAAYGVTCAHAIEGTDRNPYTRAQIGIWSPDLRQTVPVGASAFAVAGAGTGVPGAYGFMDVGIFTLEHDELRRRVRIAQPIPMAPPRPGERVSAMGTTGPKAGLVIGTETRIGSVFADVAIEIDPPGTYRGDSGMLWINETGVAVAIHAMGNGSGPGAPSSLSAGMGAHRAAAALGMSFLAV